MGDITVSSVSEKIFDGLTLSFHIDGAKTGPLSGKRFVAKDLFHVAGYRTNAGNPEWERSHPPATETARAIELLLQAGASFEGKSCTDELAFSLDGINFHYGTPLNPRMPDCIPGGSSSGSASLVAAGKVDFALGTDTSGSIRVPAAYCGIYGFRPTAGAVSAQGVVPLSPSYDCVSWFANDSLTLRECGQILLQDNARADCESSEQVSDTRTDIADKTLLIADDAFNELAPEHAGHLRARVEALGQQFRNVKTVNLFTEGLPFWMETFRLVKDWEAWQTHGDWIETHKADFAPLIRMNFEAASRVSPEQNERALTDRTRLIGYLRSQLNDDCVLCMPTTWNTPPLKTASVEELKANRLKNFSLCCVASMAGIPAVNIPAKADAPSIGISLLAWRNKDRALLDIVNQLD